MLNFTSWQLGVAYFAFCFLATLGTLQLVASHNRLVGLSLLGRRQDARAGYLLGGLLVGLGLASFFGTRQEDIQVPGLAGAELGLIFSLAFLCALATSLAVASVFYRQRTPATTYRWTGSPCREEVSLSSGRATLYLPVGESPFPAVCLVPEPAGKPVFPERLIGSLVENGFAVLVIPPAEGEYPGYPAVLAQVPAALAYLAQRAEVDGERLGVLGCDVGGDICLRAAATNRHIKALVALAPLIRGDSARPGLDLLREMSYGEAIRWSRFRGRRELLRQLDVPRYAEKSAGLPQLLVYGAEDALVSASEAASALDVAGRYIQIKVVKGERHQTLPDSTAAAGLVVHWFKENL